METKNCAYPGHKAYGILVSYEKECEKKQEVEIFRKETGGGSPRRGELSSKGNSAQSTGPSHSIVRCGLPTCLKSRVSGCRRGLPACLKLRPTLLSLSSLGRCLGVCLSLRFGEAYLRAASVEQLSKIVFLRFFSMCMHTFH